jgi:hypothetical protein
VDRPLNKGRVGRWVKAGPMEGEDKVTLWITLMDLRKIANNQVCVVLLDLNVLLVQLIIVSVDTKRCTVYYLHNLVIFIQQLGWKIQVLSWPDQLQIVELSKMS